MGRCVVSDGFRPSERKLRRGMSLGVYANVIYGVGSVSSYVSMGSDHSDFRFQTVDRVQRSSVISFETGTVAGNAFRLLK